MKPWTVALITAATRAFAAAQVRWDLADLCQ
jgi:hypothetical protein